jgi:hypothetical protein
MGSAPNGSIGAVMESDDDDVTNSSMSMNFGFVEALESIRSLTEVRAMTRLLWCQEGPRDGGLRVVCQVRPDLHRHQGMHFLVFVGEEGEREIGRP